MDRNAKHLQLMLKRAAEHKGIAFVEVFQNCVIYNDRAYDKLSDKETKDDNTLILENGKPMIYGTKKDKGIKLDGTKPVVININEGSNSINDVLIHDEFDYSPLRSAILAHLEDYDGMPTPLGVFRQIQKPTYDGGLDEQIKAVTKRKGKGDLEQVLFSSNTWIVN